MSNSLQVASLDHPPLADEIARINGVCWSRRVPGFGRRPNPERAWHLECNPSQPQSPPAPPIEYSHPAQLTQRFPPRGLSLSACRTVLCAKKANGPEAFAPPQAHRCFQHELTTILDSPIEAALPPASDLEH